MEESFVWMTTRRIKPGTLADFKRTWRPERHPDGMLHAYAYWSDDGQEIIGVSSWASREACEGMTGARDCAVTAASPQGAQDRPR
jgi:hypothetical protein